VPQKNKSPAKQKKKSAVKRGRGLGGDESDGEFKKQEYV